MCTCTRTHRLYKWRCFDMGCWHTHRRLLRSCNRSSRSDTDMCNCTVARCCCQGMECAARSCQQLPALLSKKFQIQYRDPDVGMESTRTRRHLLHNRIQRSLTHRCNRSSQPWDGYKLLRFGTLQMHTHQQRRFPSRSWFFKRRSYIWMV